MVKIKRRLNKNVGKFVGRGITKKAVKNLQSKVEKSTLGDLSALADIRAKLDSNAAAESKAAAKSADAGEKEEPTAE